MQVYPLTLVEPALHYKNAYLDMIEEWYNSGEKPIPWVLRFDAANFEGMLEQLQLLKESTNLERGQVNSSTYWLCAGNQRLLGAVNIRHTLHGALTSTGGHIGYGIRPSERRKGYATELLRLGLLEADRLGIGKALVACDKTNIGSAKAIINNGGILESEAVVNGTEVQTYSITTLLAKVGYPVKQEEQNIDRVRFPLGMFEPLHGEAFTPLIRSLLVQRIPILNLTLRRIAARLDRNRLDAPYREHGWTARQVIHHLADNDLNAYLRFKRALTESEPLASSYREDLFAQLGDYKKLPIENSLAIHQLIHERLRVLLEDIEGSSFSRTLRTEALGKVTLNVALQRLFWHNWHHMSQLQAKHSP